jgi:hypothetical protein
MPLQGANGDGRTVTSAQASEATAAGSTSKQPAVINENAAAAAAKRRPGRIQT